MANNEQRPPWWRRKTTYKWLSAPLLLVVVGAVLSAVLPVFINGREDPETDTAITTLSGEMNAAPRRVMAVAYKFAGIIKGTRPDFSTVLEDWETTSGGIAGRIPDPELRTRWREFSKAVGDMLWLSTTGIPSDRDPSRCELTQNVKDVLSPSAEKLSCWPRQTDLEQKRDCLSARASEVWKALWACNGDNVKQYSYARDEDFWTAYKSVGDQIIAEGERLSDELDG